MHGFGLLPGLLHELFLVVVMLLECLELARKVAGGSHNVPPRFLPDVGRFRPRLEMVLPSPR